MNFLDRAIAAVAPRIAVKRAAARQILAHYDGASRSHRTAWRAIGGTSANTEVAMSLPRLRDVCRDFGRNNPVATNIHGRIPGNVVGAGIIPSVQMSNKRQKEVLQGLIADHLDTTAIDYDGRNNFYGLQSLAMRTVVESGEVLIVKYVPPPRLRLPVPLQIRVLDPDYLDQTKNGPTADGGMCFQGIEFDRDGRRVAYWLFNEHPGGGLSWRFPTSARVPAEQVKHIYRMDRPGQQRGVPWGAAGIMTMWDLGNYEEAELMRQKIAACFAVFFTGPDAAGLAASAVTTPNGTPVDRLEPGLIQALPSGSQVTTATPPLMNGFRDFNVAFNRKICIAYGVPYEVGTGDLSGVSFISGRLGRIDFNVSIDQWRWHMLIPHMCVGVGQWFLEAATIARGPFKQPRFTWTPPRREMVSPKDEIPAMRDATRAGFVPRSEQVRSLGFDPEQVEDEFEAENERADEKNLRFDSDGRIPLKTSGTENIAPPDGVDQGTTPGDQPASNNQGQQ